VGAAVARWKKTPKNHEASEPAMKEVNITITFQNMKKGETNLRVSTILPWSDSGFSPLYEARSIVAA
jgi:ABC-type proline/glycine betaine transport system substrate-binding protein